MLVRKDASPKEGRSSIKRELDPDGHWSVTETESSLLDTCPKYKEVSTRDIPAIALQFACHFPPWTNI
jgi:hypothetical protein